MSTTYEEIEARLKAKAAEPSPESIKFERPGQAVIGKVRRYEKGSQRYKNWSLIVDRDEAQGQGLSYAEAAGTASAPKSQPDEPQHFPTTGDFHAADDAAAAQTAADTSTDDIPF